MAGQLFNGTAVALVASTTQTASGNSGDLRDKPNGFKSCSAASLILDVTAQSGTTPTLDVLVDTSVDNGTTWYLAFGWAQVGANTGTWRLDIRDNGIGFAEVGAVSTISSGVTSPVTQNCVMTQDIRVRWVIAGGTPSYTFAVWGIFQQAGSQI